MKNKQGFSAIAIIIILAVLALGGYAVWKKQAVVPMPIPADINIEPPAPSNLQPPTSNIQNWKTYRNDNYGFEFKYPSNSIAKTENNDRNTVVFTSDLLTFGIFVVDEQGGLGLNQYNFRFSGNGESFKQILSTFRFVK